MKKVFLSIFLLAGISLSSLAQTEEAPMREHKHQFTRELNLSDEQQKKIETLNSEYKIKFEELRDSKSLIREDKLAKRKNLFEQKQAAIRQILTPEQQTKMDAKKEAFAKRRTEARNHKGDRKRLNDKRRHRQRDVTEKLNLTPEQKQKFEELNKEFRMQSKDLSEKHKEAVKEILTPEQQNLLKDRKEKADRPNRKFARDDRKCRHVGQDHRFAPKNRKHDYKLTPETIAKLDALEDNYFQEKQSIKRSCIASEMQEKKIMDLRKKYREDRLKLVRENRKSGKEV